MADTPGVPVFCPILIGRSTQLEVLTHLLTTAHDGAGQTVLISGEAGIGKSRLVAEVKTQAARSGFTLLRGTCFEPDQFLPYAPLHDLLSNFCANHTDAEISAAFSGSRLELTRFFPELAAFLPGVTSLKNLDPGIEKHSLYMALDRVFTGMGPVLLIIEDLHWGDDASLDFLLRFAPKIAFRPVLLLLTYRNDEIQPSAHHLLTKLASERLAVEMDLPPLNREQVGEMLRAMVVSNPQVGQEFQQSLYALTEGNPFFVEEILKNLNSPKRRFPQKGEKELQPIQVLQLPRSIQDLVQRRLEGLSDQALHLLALAAVEGRRFDFPLLQNLTQWSEQELLAQMKELVASQLVIEESLDQFSFRHALTREAIYHRLLIRERKRYHGQFLAAMENVYAGSLETHAGDLAYHAFEAGIWEKALIYAQKAGEKALAFYAPYSAIDQLTRALEAAKYLNTSPPALFHARGQSYETIGDFDRALADYAQALKSASEVNDLQAKWQASIDLGFLWSGRDYAQAGGYFRQALVLARQMDDPNTIALSLNRLGNWYANIGELNQALEYHKQALAIFKNIGHGHGLAQTLDLLGMASQINGDLVNGVGYFQSALDTFTGLDERQGMISSLATLALCGPSYLHDISVSPFTLNEAIAHGDRALKMAREIDWRSGEAFALWCLSICRGPHGEYGLALEAGRQSLEISREIEHTQWMIAAHCAIGALYLDLLAFSTAQYHFDEALRLAQAVGSSVWKGSLAGFLATACAAQADFASAEAALGQEINDSSPAQTQMQRLCWCAQAEISLAQGQPSITLSIIDRLIASDPNGSPDTRLPRLWMLRGQALGKLNQLEQAEKALQAAQVAAARQGARAWDWRIHLALGQLYADQSRRAEAEFEYNAAKGIVQELAASIQEPALRDEFLEQARKLIPAPAPLSQRQAEKITYHGLTGREREVAGLIAQGWSNREIAGSLVVSERTIETHVTNILTKLGLPSRAGIAAWAVEKGLVKQIG